MCVSCGEVSCAKWEDLCFKKKVQIFCGNKASIAVEMVSLAGGLGSHTGVNDCN